MGAVVDWQLVQASAGRAVLGLSDCLRLPKTVIRLIIVVHDCLYLSLVVEAGDLCSGLAVLVPEAVDGALTRSLLPLRVLTALSFWLLRRDLNGV